MSQIHCKKHSEDASCQLNDGQGNPTKIYAPPVYRAQSWEVTLSTLTGVNFCWFQRLAEEFGLQHEDSLICLPIPAIVVQGRTNCIKIIEDANDEDADMKDEDVETEDDEDEDFYDAEKLTPFIQEFVFEERKNLAVITRKQWRRIQQLIENLQKLCPHCLAFRYNHQICAVCVFVVTLLFQGKTLSIALQVVCTWFSNYGYQMFNHFVHVYLLKNKERINLLKYELNDDEWNQFLELWEHMHLNFAFRYLPDFSAHLNLVLLFHF